MSSNRLPITVVIAVKNEAVNIAKCLRSLGPVQRAIVVDSGSSDETVSVARSEGAEVVQFEYRGGYPKKRQWALDNIEILTPWTMLLDADEVVPEELWREIGAALSAEQQPDAFLVTKGFHFLGKRMRFGGFSHSAVLLFRAGRARFERLIDDSADGLDMEVHERVIVEGGIGRLSTPLIHEDFKDLEAYIARHNKYSTWEARVRFQFISTKRYGEETIAPRLFGNAQERRRFLKRAIIRLPAENWLWFAYHFFFCLGFLEGRRGLYAAQIRSNYIAQVHAKMFELGLRGGRA
jgi:glycosyltransferase involved in cell wall biosynthesis